MHVPAGTGLSADASSAADCVQSISDMDCLLSTNNSPAAIHPAPCCCTLPNCDAQGFHLQDPEIDDVVRTAKDLEAGYIEPDTSLTAEENVELLLRTTRLLQLGLEVQYAESQTVLAENNTLRSDLRVSASSS